MYSGYQRKRIKLALAAVFIAWLIWFVPPVWRLNGGTITATQWHRVKGEVVAKVGPDQPTWIAAGKISKNVLHAFVVAEDSRFYEHSGLDFAEINASLKLNLKRGSYARGGSTITQQVVKMAYLSRQKSLIRKAREAVGAVLLEQVLTKSEILEWYINLAEFGDGVYGIKQAAWHYFRTKPELLTIQQAAHLALVLPSPNGWSLGLRRRDLTEFGHRRFATIVNRMKVAGYITENQWLNALATGNFDRPVRSYEAILAKNRRNEELNSDDLEIDEEALPVELPLEEPTPISQSVEENHGKTLLDELELEPAQASPSPTPPPEQVDEGSEDYESDGQSNLNPPSEEEAL